MRVHFCGVRGSTPSPGPEFIRYGGHTSCVAIGHDDAARPVLILDAGTGLRRATPLLEGRPFVGAVLLTHLHWDHVHGLPFFQGGDRDDARVTLLLPAQESGESAAEALSRGMSPPHFPIGPGGLRGDWTFGTLPPGQLKAEGFTVEARAVPHKGGRTYGYRVSDGHSVLTYIPDHCPVDLGPGPDGLGEYHPDALDLAAGTDLLIHDAFWLAGETAPEASFGHAAAQYAAGLGVRAGARRVALAHHKPDRTDDELDEVARWFAAGGPGAPGTPGGPGSPGGPGASGPPEIFVAAEGGIIEL